ncbi:MAG: N-acetyltransferase family protein [Marinifilaceae bacterium]
MKFEFQPLTSERFSDFEQLFGARGACEGCWCMYWRLHRKEYEKGRGDLNHEAMKQLVEEGTIPGILAYADGEPVGWCSLGPRKDYIRFETSRLFKPIDDKEVWSIVCFFVQRDWRGKGVQTQLLQYAVEYCRSRKVKILEGYPHVPSKEKMPDAFAWTGIAKAFLKAGFQEVAQPSKTRRIMRCYL